MLYLSEIMIQNPDIEHFDDLCRIVSARAAGAIHFKIDIKPAYPDTPDNWEDRLEGAFVGINSITQ